MKDRVPPNPYNGADMDTLYAACQNRAGELMARNGVVRTPAERASLALDTAHLLLATAATLRDQDVYSTTSIWHASRSDLVAAFAPKHEQALRSVRHRTLVAAADAVLGGRRDFWVRDARIDGKRAYDLALSSEEGLLQVLEHLQGLMK